MTVPFTQYLRPNGRPKPVTVDRPPGIEAVWRSLSAMGVRLEIEVLVTGQVAMSAERDVELLVVGGVDVLAYEVVPNGPEVTAAVDRLIETAWIVAFAAAMGAHGEIDQ